MCVACYNTLAVIAKIKCLIETVELVYESGFPTLYSKISENKG